MRSRFLPELLALAIAIGWALVLGPGVPLADDWGLGVLLSTESTGPVRGSTDVDFGLVLEDFHSPWLSARQWTMYRPLTTLLLSAWVSVFGLWHPWSHALNLLLHVAALLVFASILRRLETPTLARVLALLFLAVHPALVEPCMWFIAASGLLAVLAGLGAVRLALDPERRANMSALVALLVVAVLAKEDGVLALLAVVALSFRKDLAPRTAWRMRVAVLAVGIGYAILRLLALGALLPGFELGDDAPRGPSFWVTSGEKLTHLFTPMFVAAPSVVPIAGALLTALLLACIRNAKIALFLAFLLTAALLATAVHGVRPDFGGTRVLYPMLFLASAMLALASGASGRIPGRIGCVVIGLSCAGATVGLFERLAGQRRAIASSLEQQQSFARIQGEHPRTPLAITHLRNVESGVPLFLENLFFPLADQRHAAQANPVLGLQAVHHWIYASRDVLHDYMPVRIAAELGALELQYGGEDGRTLQAKPLAPQGAKHLMRTDSGSLLPATASGERAPLPFDSRALEWLEVRVANPPSPDRLRLYWQTTNEHEPAKNFAPGLVLPSGAVRFELADHYRFCSSRYLLGIVELWLESGGERVAIQSFEIGRRQPRIERRVPLYVEELRLAELAESLRGVTPAGLDDGQLYLLTPASPLKTSLPLPENELPEDWAADLQRILGIDPRLRVHAVWCGVDDEGRHMRSEPLSFDLLR